MAGLYSRYLAGLAAVNVSQTLLFGGPAGAWGRYGYWGLQEWMDADPATSYKVQGVAAYLDAAADPACDAGPPPPDDGSGGGATGWIEHREDCGYYCTFGQGSCDAITAVDGRERYWGCTCKPGYWGVECSLFGCPANCSWAGTCLDAGVCRCYPGFAGDACQIDCGCGGHGTCRADHTCACDAGFKPGPGGSGCVPDCPCDACIGPGECGCTPACKYGDCFNGACACWAGAAGLGGPGSRCGSRGSQQGACA